MEVRYWPFPIVKPEPEWSDDDRYYIEFMRNAFAEGFEPREEVNGSCIQVGKWEDGRCASLAFRGTRNGWEPSLGESQQSIRLGPCFVLGESACVCVRPPFLGAGHLALEWMRGRAMQSLLADFEFVGGYPAGIVLRSGVVASLTR
ncbi:MAG TPA: hypothetical protein VMP01_28390 [Pirellulaceae bacterium]|nr:hypothetical protein [Pirellulaceae bacterium]